MSTRNDEHARHLWKNLPCNLFSRGYCAKAPECGLSHGPDEPMKPGLVQTRICPYAEARENADREFARVEDAVADDPHEASIEPLDCGVPKALVARAPWQTPDAPISWEKAINRARLTAEVERLYDREPVYVIPMRNDRYRLFQFMCF